MAPNKIVAIKKHQVLVILLVGLQVNLLVIMRLHLVEMVQMRTDPKKNSTLIKK